MRHEQRTIDVSALPSVEFGHRSLMWWGTLGFMVIEGFTLLLLAASWFYLRLGEREWPPWPTPDPDVLIPAVNTLLLLVIILPMHRASKAAHEFDRDAVARWLTIASALTLVSVILRALELAALGVRFDAHAYASISWALVISHSVLLLTDLFETGTFAAMFAMNRAQNKHFPDVSDAALYQYFLSVGWVPVYALVYWGPRVL